MLNTNIHAPLISFSGSPMFPSFLVDVGTPISPYPLPYNTNVPMSPPVPHMNPPLSSHAENLTWLSLPLRLAYGLLSPCVAQRTEG